MNFIKSTAFFSVVLFCAFALSSEKANAQSDKYWSLGAKAAVGLNKFSGVPGTTPRRLAYMGGMIINKSYTSNFSMQAEVLLSREHYYNSGDSLETNAINNGSGVFQTHQYFWEQSMDYTYIRVPVVGKLSVMFTPRGVYPYYSKKQRIGMDFYLGGFYAYNIGQKIGGYFRDEHTQVNTANTANPDTTFIVDHTPYLRMVGDTNAKPNEIPIYKMDFGITGGLGFTYLINNRTKFSIDVRYAMGMAPLDIHGHFSRHNRKTDRSEGIYKVRSSSLQIGIGLVHRFGRDY